jgi:pimeloyl-ACP methyl ester carboxylesterase
MPDTPSPVVLVHGAWHGPWCWDRVVPLLRERGIETVALDLPSMRTGEGIERGVSADARALREALDALDRPAVVVGHSYGGMVISEGAAEHPAVKRLVYLTAFVPDVGESINDLVALVPNADLAGAIKLAPELQSSTLNPDTTGTVFYNDCDDATVEWAKQRLRPMGGNTGAPATAAAWRSIPSTYVVCTQDRAILPELQRRMARHTDEVIEWEASHSPFASQPALVAELFARLAGA